MQLHSNTDSKNFLLISLMLVLIMFNFNIILFKTNTVFWS